MSGVVLLLATGARWRIVVAALTGVGVFAACERDTVTGPAGRALPPAVTPTFDADPPALPPPEGSQVPYGLELELGIPNPVWGDAFGKIGDIPRWMVARWTIRQRVTQTGGPWGTIVAGPTGRWLEGFNNETCVLRASMYNQQSNGLIPHSFAPGGCPNDDSGMPNEVSTGILFLTTTELFGSRRWGAANAASCEGGCYTYGGSTKYIFTPTSNVLRVTANPAHVTWGAPVTFTVSRSDGGGVPSVERWLWRPRDSNRTPKTVGCTASSTTCTTPVLEDGWMFAHVVIDGYLHTAYAGVTVVPPELTLTASTTTPRVGELVTYTAGTDPDSVPDFAVTGWAFVADDTTLEGTTPACADTTCVESARVAGTMFVYGTLDGRTDTASVHITPVSDFKLTADKLTVYAGQIVRFTPLLDGSVVPAGRWLWRPAVDDPDDVAACGDNTQPCEKTVVAAGTMWAYVSSVSGQGDSAGVQIKIAIICSGSPGTLLNKAGTTALTLSTGRRVDRRRAEQGRAQQGRGVERDRLSAGRSSLRASLSTSAASACQDGGDPSGTYKQLRVITYGGVRGSPVPADSALVIAYPVNEPVEYSYDAAAGHVDLAVVVDDTAKGPTATLVMDRDHKIEVAADFDHANDPEVLALRTRFNALLRDGNKVEAFRQHLEWFANSRSSAVRDPDSVAFKLAVARILEFDYGEHGALVLGFDDALRGHAFTLSPGTGPKTVTVWSAFDNEMAGASKLQPQFNTSAAAPSPVPPAVVVFVNGIRTPVEDGEQMLIAVADLATAEPGLAGVPASLFWNRTVDAQVDAYARGLGCAGRYAWWDEIKKRLTNDVQYSRCRNKVFVRRLFEDDIAESMREFMNVVLRVPFKTPEDVPLLAQFTVDQHELGMHTIFAVHSQGNLILSQALPLIPGIRQSRQAKSKCNAAVSLASPIGRNKFMADTGSYLRGITIGDQATEDLSLSTLAGDDLLLRVSNTNYGIQKFARRTSFVRDEGVARLAQSSQTPQMKIVEGWLLSLDVHGVGRNYFREPQNSREIANFLVGLYDTCRMRTKGQD
jgi:hypothetical protein